MVVKNLYSGKYKLKNIRLKPKGKNGVTVLEANLNFALKCQCCHTNRNLYSK